MKNISLYFDKYFCSPSECTKLLTSIYSVKENLSLFRVSVLDGAFVSQHVPAITKLGHEIQKAVDDFAGIPVALLSNPKASINIHFTPPHGEYRWHYDHNVVTATLFLNPVEGCEIDIFEDYRILLNSESFASAQKVLDQVLISKASRWMFSNKCSVIHPEVGGLLMMKGDRCLHSIRQVRGTSDRVSIEFAFDVPGRVQTENPDPVAYFYSDFPKSA